MKFFINNIGPICFLVGSILLGFTLGGLIGLAIALLAGVYAI